MIPLFSILFGEDKTCQKQIKWFGKQRAVYPMKTTNHLVVSMMLFFTNSFGEKSF